MFKICAPKEKTKLDNINNIILIASGKGSVEKSTIVSNIAIYLAGLGCKVALLDHMFMDHQSLEFSILAISLK